MNITLKQIPIRDLVKCYTDSQEQGVTAYDGMLDVRPAYQREFVYKDKQRNAVIETVFKGFPLNTMYWAVNKDRFEVLDGQQRTISICQYVNNEYSIKRGGEIYYFHNLTDVEKNAILDYELFVYICDGNDKQKLDWFSTINIAGEKLTTQELRNAVYTGPWLSDAKKYFSKTGAPAYNIGKDYIKGSPIRQELLEKALKGISEGDIEQYMADNQHNPTAIELWSYYQSVIAWIKSTFTVLRKKEMQTTDFFKLYNEFGNAIHDPIALENEIAQLMADDEVTKKSGIYNYVLTRDEKYLSIRTFTDSQKRTKYAQQDGICPSCNDKHDISNMEGDHIDPWSQGGKTDMDNLQMLCKPCNRRKSDK